MCSDRHVYLVELVLVADRLPVGIAGGVRHVVAPEGAGAPRRFVHRQQRQVLIDALQSTAVAGCISRPLTRWNPGQVHRPARRAHRPFDKRVGRADQRAHRPQVGRMGQRGQPLDAAQVGAAGGADVAVAPGLRRDPLDHVVAVRPVVAIGHEHAVRVAPPAHVHHDIDIAALGKIAPRRGDVVLVVGRAHHQRGIAALRARAGNVGGQRHAVAHRNSYIEQHPQLVGRRARGRAGPDGGRGLHFFGHGDHSSLDLDRDRGPGTRDPRAGYADPWSLIPCSVPEQHRGGPTPAR